MISHRPRLVALLLVAPALTMVTLLFLLPLLGSASGAFMTPDGPALGNFIKAFELYWIDILYTIGVVGLSVLLTGLCAILIAGCLSLGESRHCLAALRWLYRWPMFVPFIVVGQTARCFLARNGLMNNMLVSSGLLDPLSTTSLLDWRGIVLAFVWKQTPFASLLLAGAMAALDRAGIEAARSFGASRPRILLEIILPQVRTTLFVTLVLAFVTMMSVLSVPLMVASQSPTLINVDIAFRINSYGDYGVANALGMISLLITACVAWFYLSQNLRNYS